MLCLRVAFSCAFDEGRCVLLQSCANWDQTLDSDGQSKSLSFPMKRFPASKAGPLSIAALCCSVIGAAGLALFLTPIANAEPEVSPGRLPRTNLLVFHNS